jgi:hypothetical protein
MYDKAYHNRIAARQLRGWTLEEATRSIEQEIFELDGTKLPLEEWCAVLDLHSEDTYFRIIRGHKLRDIVKERHE